MLIFLVLLLISFIIASIHSQKLKNTYYTPKHNPKYILIRNLRFINWSEVVELFLTKLTYLLN